MNDGIGFAGSECQGRPGSSLFDLLDRILNQALLCEARQRSVFFDDVSGEQELHDRMVLG
jgi:hypothetical protein